MNNTKEENNFPIFTMANRGILLLCGIYTIAWAGLFKWFGPALFSWLAMQSDFDTMMNTGWYGTIGIIAGVLLFLSAFYPVSWIYLLAIGLTGKLISIISFLLVYLPNLEWNKRIGFHLFFNESLFLLLIAAMLWKAWKVKKYLATLPD
ncbi:hypothetical protein [uncultured Cyclobacterium sp.]|uniref:hypothetical protein n=1 Tax=uncultured Cyclobacterium sp. TaxID=453820 RepID=UPI0030EB24B2